MDPILEAKKSVLRDLIGDMRKKMVAMGQTPEGEPAAEDDEAGESEMDDELSEAPSESGAAPRPPVTITLAAIKKGSAARAPKGPPPFVKDPDKPSAKKKG